MIDETETSPMGLPDFRGYNLDSQIYSTASRLIVLWFSKMDYELERWRQIQVTLVNARLSMANMEIARGFPPLRSCELSRKPTAKGNRKLFAIHFDSGEISFECEEITCSEFSRKVRVLRESGL